MHSGIRTEFNNYLSIVVSCYTELNLTHREHVQMCATLCLGLLKTISKYCRARLSLELKKHMLHVLMHHKSVFANTPWLFMSGKVSRKQIRHKNLSTIKEGVRHRLRNSSRGSELARPLFLLGFGSAPTSGHCNLKFLQPSREWHWWKIHTGLAFQMCLGYWTVSNWLTEN